MGSANEICVANVYLVQENDLGTLFGMLLNAVQTSYQAQDPSLLQFLNSCMGCLELVLSWEFHDACTYYTIEVIADVCLI